MMKFLKSLNFAHDEELIFYAFLVISPKLSQEELISEGRVFTMRDFLASSMMIMMINLLISGCIFN